MDSVIPAKAGIQGVHGEDGFRSRIEFGAGFPPE